MNIQHLRHSLKVKWLLYYRQNRPWLVRLRIWGTYDGQRRPVSSFILAAIFHLEPQLTELLPFMIDLSSNPDQIVAALGLNFNPDEELKSITDTSPIAKTNANGNGVSVQVLDEAVSEDGLASATQASNLASWVDESCHGKANSTTGLVLSILVVIGTVAIIYVGFA